MRTSIKKTVCCALTASIMAGIFAVPATAASTKKGGLTGLTNKQVVQQMGLGWNLGNHLDCSGVNFTECTAPADWETAWSNPVATKAMISKVKAEGFNTLRIPVTWGDKLDASGKIDPQWMARVKEIVDWGYEENMYVIVNTHHEEMTGFTNTKNNTKFRSEYTEYTEAQTVCKYATGWLKVTKDKETETIATLQNIWKQIATEFKDYDEHLVFEVINEPRYVDEAKAAAFQDGQDWDGKPEYYDVVNDLNKAGVEAIRSVPGNSAEERAIMIPTYAAQLKEAPIEALFEGMKKIDDDNLIVSIHAYEPIDLCLAKGDKGEDITTEFTEEGKKILDAKFALLDKYFINNDIPVVLGETSITNRNNREQRQAWCKYYASLASERHIPIILWDSGTYGKENPKSGENHGWLNRNLNKWYEKDTTDALVYAYYGLENNNVYYDEPDLKPTEKDFTINTVWQGRESAPAGFASCKGNDLPYDGVALDKAGIAKGSLVAGTAVEIDYDPAQAAPHLVLYAMDSNYQKLYYVDVYPTEVDTVKGEAYFAYETIINTLKGATDGKYTTLREVDKMMCTSAFAPVTATALKICTPKAGSTYPNPLVDLYEDRDFWKDNNYSIPAPGEDDPSSSTPDSSSQAPVVSTPDSSSQAPVVSTPDSSSQAPVVSTPDSSSQAPVVSTPDSSSEAPIGAYTLGDPNADGTINTIDALFVLKCVVGLNNPTAEQKAASDVTKDGVLASDDALEILKYVVGIVKAF